MVLLGAALLGGLGALARVSVDRFVSLRAGGALPFGILAINLSGALALGVLSGVGVHGDAFKLAGAGLLGGYTTFSTWMAQSHELDAAGQRRAAALNITLSLLLGFTAVALGHAVA